jgi:hypothetical protein
VCEDDDDKEEKEEEEEEELLLLLLLLLLWASAPALQGGCAPTTCLPATRTSRPVLHWD